MKLFHKLSSGFLIVSFLICISGLFNIQLSKAALEKVIEKNSIMLAQETLNKIDRSIYKRIEEMQVYSNDHLLRELIVQSNEKFDAMESPLTYIDEKDKEWRALPEESITPFMQTLIDSELFEELKDRLEFYEKKYDHKVYTEVFVTNKYGANVGQTNKTTDYFQADEEWWQVAKQQGLYTGDIKYDDSAKSYSMEIGIRINDDNGDFLGVMKALLSLEESIDVLHEIDVKKKAMQKDSTGNGRKQARNSELHFKLISKEGKLLYSSEHEYETMNDINPEILSMINNKSLGSYIVKGELDGERDKLISYARSQGYRDYKGLGWTLVLKHDRNEILAPIDTLKYYILVVSLAVTFGGILIGVLISSSIRKSIKNLSDAITKVGEGNLDGNININTKDEIGMLANSFNKMTENLRNITSSRDELNIEVAERIKAEEELIEIRRQNELILNAAGEGIYGLDLNGNTTFMNPAVAKMIGWEADELIGKSQHDILHHTRADGTHYPREECHIYAAFKEGSVTKVDNEVFWRKDGSSFPVEYISTPIRDENDSIIGAVVTFRDITDRKKAEEELKQSHNTILQQEKMASIGQLAAGVAHEINNPTGFISSNLGTLGKYVSRFTEFIEAQTVALESIEGNGVMEELSEKKKKLKIEHISNDVTELINECKNGTDRIKGIVDGLKGFSRVDENERKSIDINQCLDSTLNILNNELKYKCTLNKDYGTLPSTLCYPQQLTQVFVNLLVNASQAIEKQGEIKIKTGNDDESIFVSISDTGSGIPDDKLRKVFEPFYTTKAVGQGTGLGLSISYEIVKKHGGELTVESEVGKGTTFNIRLPIEESADV